MHCSDLERYLEACLDGQLGDSRRRALKDHLAYCKSCRARVDALRQFEADLQRRLRSMRHEVSLWQPLGLETVGGTLPVPRPTPVVLRPARPDGRAAAARHDAAAGDDAAAGERAARRGHRLRALPGPAAAAVPSAPQGLGRRLQSLAGVALIVAAVAAIADAALTGLGWLSGDRRAAVYRAYVDGDLPLDLRTAEAARLSGWLGEQLGVPVSLPAAPGGFALVGGKALSSGELALDEPTDKAGMAVYTTAEGPAVLMIETLAADDGDSAPTALPEVVVEDGLARLDWQDGPHAYSLIGALSADQLALFAD